jgi:sugar/nucleoside kinase (ribokinase family)
MIQEMPEVVLKTSGEGEREETYKNLSSQLSIHQVMDWNQYDGILINMITGFDISIDQLKIIRRNFNGTIYFDVHTLSRGVGLNMKREFRPIPQINEWLSNVDILQCNENELKTIIPNKIENESAIEILEHGVKIVIITKGDKGAHLYFGSDDKMKTNFIEAVKINTVNKIGCGDIFGAVFFYSYISTRDVSKSLMLANRAGALAAATKDIVSQTVLRIV